MPAFLIRTSRGPYRRRTRGGDELLDDTSIAWWGADGPGFDRRTPTVIVSHTTPDDVSAGGVYTFVPSPREAAEVAVGLAGGKDVDRITESSKATHLRYRVLTVDGTG